LPLLPARAAACVLGMLGHPHPRNTAHGRGINHLTRRGPPQSAAAPPAIETGAEVGGRPREGVLGVIPTTRVATRAVSSIPSTCAAPLVRSQAAPLCAYGPRSITGTISRRPR